MHQHRNLILSIIQTFFFGIKKKNLDLKITIVININHGNWIVDKHILIVLDSNYFLFSFLLSLHHHLSFFDSFFLSSSIDICKLSLSSHIAHGISMFFLTISIKKGVNIEEKTSFLFFFYKYFFFFIIFSLTVFFFYILLFLSIHRSLS